VILVRRLSRLPQRFVLPLAAAVACCLLGASPGSGQMTAAPGSQLWASVYHGPGARSNQASAVAFGGRKVFVTGTSSSTANSEYATVAYDAATGQQLWARRFRGPGIHNSATCITASKDGTRVFVSGASDRTLSGRPDYTTVAYNASSGQELWVARYDGPAHGADYPSSIVLTSGGNRLFVTGGSTNDYATVAYDAATGTQLWASRYDGPVSSSDYASAIALNANDTKVVVTGTSDTGESTSGDYATVAYDAATGQQLWVNRYNGAFNGSDRAVAVAVAGGRTYVSGTSLEGNADYTTIAYDTATGATVWRRSEDIIELDSAEAMVANSDGTEVFVSGYPYTIAYSASGQLLWEDQFRDPSNPTSETAHAHALVLDGYGKLIATGTRYRTVFYDVSTGNGGWVSQDDNDSSSNASSIAVNSAGSKVFVTGWRIQTQSAPSDYLTIAYQS
jgi:outer membrane protein assembly factor BamB